MPEWIVKCCRYIGYICTCCGCCNGDDPDERPPQEMQNPYILGPSPFSEYPLLPPYNRDRDCDLFSDFPKNNSKGRSIVLNLRAFEVYEFLDLLASAIATLATIYREQASFPAVMRPQYFSYRGSCYSVPLKQAGFSPKAVPRELECCYSGPTVRALNPFSGIGSANAIAVPVAGMSLVICDPFTMAAACLFGLVNRTVAFNYLANLHPDNYVVSVQGLKEFVYINCKGNDPNYVKQKSEWQENKVRKLSSAACLLGKKSSITNSATLHQKQAPVQGDIGRKKHVIFNITETTEKDWLREEHALCLKALQNIYLAFSKDNSAQMNKYLKNEQKALKIRMEVIKAAFESLEPPLFQKNITENDIAEVVFGLMKLSVILMFYCLSPTQDIEQLIWQHSTLGTWWIPSIILTQTIVYRLDDSLLSNLKEADLLFCL